MTSDEDQIRQSLHNALDASDVPSQIPPTTLMRARSRRFASLGATAVVALVVGAAGAWGALAMDNDTPNRVVAPPTASSLIRLVTDPTNGGMEIEASKGQACYRFEMRGATSAHIHEQGSSDTLVDLPVNLAGNYAFLGCADGLDPDALQAIAERPSDHVVEFHNSVSRGTEIAALSPEAGELDCLPTELTSPEYGLHFPEKEGQPGDQVTAWGTTLRTEGGDFAPSDRLELWWNAQAPDEDRPKKDGQAIRLASVQTEDRCYFITSFTVPDVPDGEYDITGFVWDEPPSEDYGVFPGTDFTVVSSSSDLPPCEDENTKSYGQEPPGLWLKDVLLELGAPGGHPLAKDDVRDTGTALWIDIPEYDNDPTIYATMLTPGADPNVAESETETEIGTRQSYTLYFNDTDYQMESYKAVNENWQLALLAYPGADNDEVMWPDGTVEWLKQAVDIAEQSPPQCEGPIT